MEKIPFLFYRILGPDLSRKISVELRGRINNTRKLRDNFIKTIPALAEQLRQRANA
jgi:hypothetical protein